MALNKMDKIHAFQSMLFVARDYDVEIEPEYEEMEELLLTQYDLNVYDMMGSLKHIHQDLKDNL